MATEQILAERRAHAATKIERRVAGLARAFNISLPQRIERNYPDAQHRQADLDERIVEILTAVLRAKDPKAVELRDAPVGTINETITSYDEDEKGNVNVSQRTQAIRR